MDDLPPLPPVDGMEESWLPLPPDGAYNAAQAPVTQAPSTTNHDIPPDSSLGGLSKQYHPKMLFRSAGGENLLQRIRRDPYGQYRQDNIYYPFASRGEWQLAQWLINSSLTQAQTDSFLKLEEVSNCHIVSYNTLTFHHR